MGFQGVCYEEARNGPVALDDLAYRKLPRASLILDANSKISTSTLPTTMEREREAGQTSGTLSKVMAELVYRS